MHLNIKKHILNRTKKYYIASNDFNSTEEEFLDKIATAIKNGADIVECKITNNPKQLLEYGRKARQLCSIYNKLFIINDRVDIATLLEADGVFLNDKSIDVVSAKQIIDDNLLIGSCIPGDGVDYVLLCDNNQVCINIHKFIKKGEFYEV